MSTANGFQYLLQRKPIWSAQGIFSTNHAAGDTKLLFSMKAATTGLPVPLNFSVSYHF